MFSYEDFLMFYELTINCTIKYHAYLKKMLSKDYHWFLHVYKYPRITIETPMLLQFFNQTNHFWQSSSI